MSFSLLKTTEKHLFHFRITIGFVLLALNINILNLNCFSVSVFVPKCLLSSPQRDICCHPDYKKNDIFCHSSNKIILGKKIACIEGVLNILFANFPNFGRIVLLITWWIQFFVDWIFIFNGESWHCGRNLWMKTNQLKSMK